MNKNGSKKRSASEAEPDLPDASPDSELANSMAHAALLEELNVHREELEAQNEELYAAHLEMQAGLERFAQLFNFAPVGYVRLTANGLVTDMNHTGETLLQADRRTIVDRPFVLFVAASDRTAFQNFLDGVLSSDDKKTAEFELDVDLFAAERRLARFTATRLAGGTPSVLLAFEDVTAEKRAEELERASEQAKLAERELREADRRKDEFLAVLSHELRTPLTTILMHAQLLRRHDDPAVKKSSAIIERATRAQASLVEDLLDVSRIVAGKLTFEKRPSSLAKLVQEAVHSVELDAKKKRIVLKSTIASNLPLVHVDPTRLQQAVWNLLSNAVKFTPEGGGVDVEVGIVDEEARVQVRDTGRGMDPAFLPHVFDRFRQAESAATRTIGGLGLGLSIAKAVVEWHGGTIRAASRGQGRGSTFVIALPLTNACPIPDSTYAEGGTVPQVKLAHSRILVVEDDADTRETFIHVLELAGAEVRGASDAAVALDVLECFEPDLLVSDIAMPSDDGCTLLRRTRERWPERPMRALALTALASEEDQARVTVAGFDQYVVKPIDMQSFLSTVSRLLHGNSGNEASVT